MTEQKQIEKFVNSALDDRDLDWEVALVEFNQASHSWNIEMEVPDGPEVLITIPHGTPDEMKRAVKEQMDEEVERVKAHRH
jgi:hypothetical protein